MLETITLLMLVFFLRYFFVAKKQRRLDESVEMYQQAIMDLNFLIFREGMPERKAIAIIEEKYNIKIKIK